MTIALIALVVISLAGGGTFYATQNSLPGETLYVTKLRIEEFRLAVSPDNVDTNLYLRFAAERLEEMKTMASQGQFDYLPYLADQLEWQMNAFSEATGDEKNEKQLAAMRELSDEMYYIASELMAAPEGMIPAVTDIVLSLAASQEDVDQIFNEALVWLENNGELVLPTALPITATPNSETALTSETPPSSQETAPENTPVEYTATSTQQPEFTPTPTLIYTATQTAYIYPTATRIIKTNTPLPTKTSTAKPTSVPATPTKTATSPGSGYPPPAEPTATQTVPAYPPPAQPTATPTESGGGYPPPAEPTASPTSPAYPPPAEPSPTPTIAATPTPTDSGYPPPAEPSPTLPGYPDP